MEGQEGPGEMMRVRAGPVGEGGGQAKKREEGSGLHCGRFPEGV
jgi:hypothetical protein